MGGCTQRSGLKLYDLGSDSLEFASDQSAPASQQLPSCRNTPEIAGPTTRRTQYFSSQTLFFAAEHVFQRLLPKNLELWRATREEGGRICAMLFTGPRVKKEVRESVHHEGARGSAASCSWLVGDLEETLASLL